MNTRIPNSKISVLVKSIPQIIKLGSAPLLVALASLSYAVAADAESAESQLDRLYDSLSAAAESPAEKELIRTAKTAWQNYLAAELDLRSFKSRSSKIRSRMASFCWAQAKEDMNSEMLTRLQAWQESKSEGDVCSSYAGLNPGDQTNSLQLVTLKSITFGDTACELEVLNDSRDDTPVVLRAAFNICELNELLGLEIVVSRKMVRTAAPECEGSPGCQQFRVEPLVDRIWVAPSTRHTAN